MGSATHEGALRRGTEGADEKLVKVLEETATHKVLEKLEEPLRNIVHEAVAEAIVHAVHADPRVRLPRRPARQRVSTEVKRPKEGGRCEKVWKELDRLAAKRDTPPQLQDILRVGERRSWNPNNTRVEYYQWRKANGISGRLSGSHRSGKQQQMTANA